MGRRVKCQVAAGLEGEKVNGEEKKRRSWQKAWSVHVRQQPPSFAVSTSNPANRLVGGTGQISGEAY
jgi:hypothetical protein